MTVQNANNKNIYVGNGVTTVFSFTFSMVEENADHIKVYVTNDEGVDVATNNYTVDLAARSITYPKTGTPLAEGQNIIIARELPLIQLLNLVNQGPFFAEELEKAFDKEIMLLQQIKERVSRTLSMGISVDGDVFNSVVPLVPGKSFRINDDGTALETTEDPARVLPLAQNALEETKAARDEAQAIKDSVADGIDFVIDNIDVAKEAGEKAAAAKAYIDETLVKAETAYNNAVEYDQKITSAKDTALLAADASLQYKTEAEQSKLSANTAVTNAADLANVAYGHALQAEQSKLDANSAAINAADLANVAYGHALQAEYVAKNVNVFVPYVDDNGYLRWQNAAGLPNPTPVYIVGPQGPQGPEGAGLVILGEYDSYSQLIAVHPSGKPGDSYLIQGEVWYWASEENKWNNAGKLQGPAGKDGQVDYSVIYTKSEVDELIASKTFSVAYYGNAVDRNSDMPQYGIEENVGDIDENALGKGLLGSILLGQEV